MTEATDRPKDNFETMDEILNYCQDNPGVRVRISDCKVGSYARIDLENDGGFMEVCGKCKKDFSPNCPCECE